MTARLARSLAYLTTLATVGALTVTCAEAAPRCPDGWTSTWVKHRGHVLAGDGSLLEQDSIQEMMVLPDPTGRAQLRAWYTTGWIPASLATAVSNDGGLTWEQKRQIVGHGLAGVQGNVAHTGLVVDGRRLHITYTDPTEETGDHTTLNRVTSTDGGLTWGRPRVILEAQGWESGRWGNSATVIRNGVWHMLYDAMDHNRIWQVGYATSRDGLTWTRRNGGQPITSLAVGGPENMYGGPDLHLRRDGTWVAYYHAAAYGGNLPTRIYRAESRDLIHWTRHRLLLDMSQGYEFDQVADPHVLRVNGRKVMFYEGVNNITGVSRANRAVLRWTCR